MKSSCLITIIVQISIYLFFFFASRRCPHHSCRQPFNHILVLFNLFLFTLWLLCRSSSSSCSAGNLPLWLFWLVQGKLWQFLRKLWRLHSPMRPSCRVMSCHAMVLTCTLALHWLPDSLFSWIWLAEIKCPFFFLNLDTCVVAVVKVLDKTTQSLIGHLLHG